MSDVTLVEKYMPELLRLLEESVNMDSPSRNKALCDRMADWYEIQFRRLTGGTVTRLPHEVAGDRLLCEWGAGSRRILLLGHYDTVWPEGEASRRPYGVRGGRALGPGVYDMKLGLLQAMFALKLLGDEGRGPAEDVTVVLLINSDEEISSPSSRGLIEQTARGCEAVFVLEPPMEPEGALKTGRKGSGRYKLIVEGIAAHAGVDPSKGVSAIEELAHQIQHLHGLTDYGIGTTVNVGIVHGGIGTNVVADRAEAEIDVRVKTSAEAERVHALIAGLRSHLPGARLRIEGRMMRPPMERTDAIARLYGLARRIAADELGFELGETATGGVSDGNFTAACGVPTLDGLGARGDFAHSPDEYVRLDEIAPRTALLARLIETVAAGERR
ncbi:M20 family metallopeptidase [Paenibacillus sp. RC84]|uniref:M20 family metallopeptidase n=1 Tax=Paenibacillus sp. RC84 TaxID=3156252 RepID=UPI003519D4D4